MLFWISRHRFLMKRCSGSDPGVSIHPSRFMESKNDRGSRTKWITFTLRSLCWCVFTSRRILASGIRNSNSLMTILAFGLSRQYWFIICDVNGLHDMPLPSSRLLLVQNGSLVKILDRCRNCPLSCNLRMVSSSVDSRQFSSLSTNRVTVWWYLPVSYTHLTLPTIYSV